MLRRFAAVLACTLFAAPAFAEFEATVVIQNDSQWSIHNLYLSDVDSEEWGPDQLGDEVIESGGGKFTLTDIPCDAYDVKLVDEDGDECVVNAIALCVDKGNWVITDEPLLACQNGG
jgi:hypothetical protein